MFRVFLLGIGVSVAGLASIGDASSHPVDPGEGSGQVGYLPAPIYPLSPQHPAYVAPGAPVAVIPVPAEPVYMVPLPVPYAYPGVGPIYVRPANCGEYRYWDGTECVDARDVPPLGSRY